MRHPYVAPIFCISLLVAHLVWAGTPGDLTGVHKDLQKCNSADGAASGPAYMRPCYEGFAHENGISFFLVQNGHNICGTFEACGGWNCSKVYFGEVVGLIRGNSVSLFYADGHIENGDANFEKFDISADGELLIPGSRKRAFTKTSPGVITPEDKTLCQPQIRLPVRIKDYELENNGTGPNLRGFAPTEVPVFLPPKSRTVRLTEKQSEVHLHEGPRARGNLIPRIIWIENTTNYPWNISIQLNAKSEFSDDACARWLQESEKKMKSYVWAYSNSYPSEQVPPRAKRYTRVCAGDTLELEKDLSQ